MAKMIEQPSGERMIVSDDMPDFDFGEEEVEKKDNSILLTESIVDPLNLLFYFESELESSFPIIVKTYNIEKGITKIKGNMLTSDYLWLIENKDKYLTKLEVRLPNKNYVLLDGMKRLNTIKAKRIDAVTCKITLSFNCS